jgi:hypothetical protein
MKPIFFLIIAANILFFVHQYFFTADEAGKTVLGSEGQDTVSPKKLFLLSERAGLNVPVKKSADKNPPLGGETKGLQNEAAPLCTMIGPYEQLLQAEYAVERLAALGAAVHMVPIEIKEGESFWVYLGPEISEREALNRLYELQKKNIDSHIISKGELANGVSLGRFSGYQEAESLVQKIGGDGYSAQIKIMPKIIQETWVVVDDGFAEKVDSSVWEELIRKQKGLEKRQNYCLGVASQ